MPEGPEVKRIAEKLRSTVVDKNLESIEILSGRYLKHGPPDNFNNFAKSLPVKISDVACKGKFIYIILENGTSVWNTLGMSGGWSSSPKKNSRIKLNLGTDTVFFNDMRNFGTIKISSDIDQLHKKLESLGPDMLSDEVSDDVFMSRIQKKSKKTVAEAIMNQSIISGVGNYLKSESLYLAQISPHRTVESLSSTEISNLNSAIRTTIRSSYLSGGATIHTFLNFDDTPGEYSRRFAVYNQKSDIMGNQVVREVTKDKRTSFWVPDVQK